MTTDNQGWTTIICTGCHAERKVHELMNANSPSVNLCPYCKTPQYSQEVLEEAIQRVASAGCTSPWGGLL